MDLRLNSDNDALVLLVEVVATSLAAMVAQHRRELRPMVRDQLVRLLARMLVHEFGDDGSGCGVLVDKC